MKTLILLLLLVGAMPEVKAQLQFLGKTIGEAKFLAVQDKINLSSEVEIDEERTAMMYKTTVKTKSGVNFTMSHSLVFNSQRNDICYLVSSVPSLQEQWVADTLINRLKKKKFKKIDGNTFVRDNWIAKFEYVNALDTKTGKKTGINIMRVNFKLEE